MLIIYILMRGRASLLTTFYVDDGDIRGSSGIFDHLCFTTFDVDDGYLWSASGIAIECDRPAFCGKSVAAWALVEDVRRN